MKTKIFRGTPYHLWNPYTPMDKYLKFFGFGPMTIVRGEGNYVYNQNGKRYLNANSSTWNFALGYGREEIIKAVNDQMKELAFSSLWGHSHPRAIELAAKLVEITGGHFQHVMLGSNGSEAVEAALKLSRQFHRQSPNALDHGRYKIISLREGYHGVSFGAVTAAGKEVYSEKFGPLVPGFLQIDPPYCYRCPYGKTGYPECALVCADALEETIRAEGKETVAAFLMEPVMGEYGVIIPPEPYYTAVGDICKRNGVLLIADEVTTGFGRTGKLFASQDWDPQPDIICLGKIISGGYLPLAATLTTGAIFERFLGADKYFMHGSTNSGHPAACAAGLAAIDIILRENLPENAANMGEYFKTELETIKGKFEIVGDVRVKGLMVAVELVKDQQTKEPLNKDELFDYVMDVVERGVLISLDSLRFLPPLNITQEQAAQIVRAVGQALVSNKAGRMFRLAMGFIRSKISA
ncbi:MAG: aspartate aminotransferase family protein [Anaerolineaceae bacterium]|nr:aspartate aminotransferase family protein [Anaerolineaceae bacterium]